MLPNEQAMLSYEVLSTAAVLFFIDNMGLLVCSSWSLLKSASAIWLLLILVAPMKIDASPLGGNGKGQILYTETVRYCGMQLQKIHLEWF